MFAGLSVPICIGNSRVIIAAPRAARQRQLAHCPLLPLSYSLKSYVHGGGCFFFIISSLFSWAVRSRKFFPLITKVELAQTTMDYEMLTPVFIFMTVRYNPVGQVRKLQLPSFTSRTQHSRKQNHLSAVGLVPNSIFRVLGWVLGAKRRIWGVL